MTKLCYRCDEGLVQAYELAHWRAMDIMARNRRIGIRDGHKVTGDELHTETGERPSGAVLAVIQGGKQ